MRLSSALANTFRAYDIRGVVGAEFNTDFARTLGRALGTLCLHGNPASFPPRSIPCARDCRLSSPALHHALMEGICAAGIDVVDLGQLPSPCLYYAVLHLQRRGGVIVTASHNPPEYNGFKLWKSKEALIEPELKALRLLMEEENFGSGCGAVSTLDIVPAYTADIVRRLGADSASGLRVVVDGGNGVAGKICASVLRAIGAEVIELYCDPDGRFPHHQPDPTREENVRDMRIRLLETRADLAFGLDGDGDRLSVMDASGRLLQSDEVLAIFARDLLSRHPDAPVMGDVKCSNHFFHDIAEQGGSPVMCRSGRSLVREAMLGHGALLGGELSGHLFHADNWYGFDDATYAAARLLGIVKKSDTPLTALPGWPQSWITREINHPCPDHLKFAVTEKARQWYAERWTVNNLDGVRVDFGGAWGLVRVSNTSPSISMRFEADSPARLQELRNTAETMVKKWIQEAEKELKRKNFQLC